MKGLKRDRQKKIIGYFLFPLILFFLFCIPSIFAQNQGSVNAPSLTYGWIRLAWDPPDDANVAGYRIYWGSDPRNYNGAIDVGNNTDCLVFGLVAGRNYYFAVAAYDSSNFESDFSNEITARGTSPGDFNQDGNPDILWWHRGRGEVALWYMDGESPVSPQGIAILTTSWRIMGVADFNRDGNPDILWRHQATGEIALWYMSGASRVSSQGIATVPDFNWEIVGPK